MESLTVEHLDYNYNSPSWLRVDDAVHVINEAPPLDRGLEQRVEAFVNGVKHGSQDGLVVSLGIADHVDGHVDVAAEDGRVVANLHDVALVDVWRASRGTFLLLA